MFCATAGIQTAALAFGGYSYIPGGGATKLSSTEAWNGSAWTSGGSLPTAVGQLSGMGTQTAAVSVLGQAPPNAATAASNNYNGTTWTASGNANTARTQASSAGSQTAGLIFGGNSGSATGATELYNGSTFTSNPTGLGTAREGMAQGPVGNQTAAIGAGSGPAGVSVEAWNVGFATKTITVS
jgi:hypothetical protein